MASERCDNRNRFLLRIAAATSAGLMTVMTFVGVLAGRTPQSSASGATTPVCYYINGVLICQATPTSIPDTLTVR